MGKLISVFKIHFGLNGILLGVGISAQEANSGKDHIGFVFFCGLIEGFNHLGRCIIIRIHKADVFACGYRKACVSGIAGAGIGLMDDLDPTIGLGQFVAKQGAGFFGTVIHQNDLELRKRLVYQRIQTSFQIFFVQLRYDLDYLFCCSLYFGIPFNANLYQINGKV